ncbi:hypothetical protein, partial [Flavivirga aquatica]|uniref:hypothetical protein n=1 Tax=Flavivirga aquatica TaxID=1849968 RepID=UPI00196A8456
MKYIIVSFFLFITLSSCFGQKKVIIEKDSLLKESKLSDLLFINESFRNSIHEGNKVVLRVNNKGFYEYKKDSTLYNGSLDITLHKDFNNDTGPKIYGSLSGDIKDGKKEGEWEKEVFVKGEESAIVKVMNYANGVLHGKYQVFDLKGNVLTP